MNAYWPILLMMLIGAAIAVVSMTLSKLVGQPATEGAQDKRDPYECGMESDGSTLLHVPVKFYQVCLLFLLFDVETIFLIAWVMAYSELGATPLGALYWLGAMAIFLLFLVVGFAYEWKRKALEWQ